MYSSKDLERFYFHFASRRISPVVLCKEPSSFNIFQKWFKDTRNKVVEVQIEGAPVINKEEKSKTSDQPQIVSKNSNDTPIRIWIDIRISNGVHLSQKHLSYQNLVRMVEKQEDLCRVLPVLINFTDMRCKHSRVLSIIRE